jgi:hypothetical protein
MDELVRYEKQNSKIKCMDDLLKSGKTWNI